jgi:hypothetical protein
MTGLRAMTAVYSFLFPEVAAVAAEVEATLLPRLLRNDAPAADLAAWVVEHAGGRIDVPATGRGCADLDAIAAPIAERAAEIVAPLAPGLTGFPHRYQTSGSSEGIFHLIAEAASGGVRRVRVLAGEYEGYGFYASACGLAVEVFTPGGARAAEPAADALWMISNPSARDGCLLPPDLIPSLLDAGHRMVVDLAYAGSAAAMEASPVDVSHPGVSAVVVSMSKPYGLFRWRTGWTLSRTVMPSLIGNKWFSDPGRGLLGLAVLERVGPFSLPARYAAASAAVTDRLAVDEGVPLLPADVLLIAHAPAAVLDRASAPVRERLSPYRRADSLRLCLTPYLEDCFPPA